MGWPCLCFSLNFCVIMVSLLFLFLLVTLLTPRCYCGCGCGWCSCKASHRAWTVWRQVGGLRSEVCGLRWGRPRVSSQAPRASRSLPRRAKNVGRADQREHIVACAASESGQTRMAQAPQGPLSLAPQGWRFGGWGWVPAGSLLGPYWAGLGRTWQGWSTVSKLAWLSGCNSCRTTYCGTR